MSPLVLAHRGASVAAPENTIEAFTRARELGADGVELDARRTAEGVLVVHHDPHAADVGLLAAAPFATLRAMRPDIPTLEEAIAACAGMLVNVEVKCLPWEPDADTPDYEVVGAVAALVADVAPDAIVSSFDLGAVDACRLAAPALATAWLTMGQELVGAATLAAARGHVWLHPALDDALQASPADIAAVHALGVRVDVWTVDEPDEIRLLAQWGVDGVITNTPDRARRAFTGESPPKGRRS